MNAKPSIFSELRRRNLLRAGALYVAAAWALAQGAAQLLPVYDVSAWVLRWIIAALVIGFPFWLAFAWFYELTPSGLRRESEIAPDDSIAHSIGRKLDYWIIGILAVAVVLLATNQFVLHRDATGTANTVDAKAIAATLVTVPAKSIAVLPFENLSDNTDNVYFSDGLSEEILNSLARVDGLRVIGRTSSFQFKGKDVDARTIGERLGVANLLEGSVRREGERARVTAQLIRASDGTQLWSQTYDRTVKDSLAVQLDIAEQVAGVLNVVLDAKQRARMRAAGVKNVDAFIAYQKGWKLYIDAHNGDDLIGGLRQANFEFDKAIALDPNFSFAYFAEADLYEHTLLADGRSRAERLDAQRAALHTLERAAATSPDPQQRDLALAERQILSDDWHGLADRIEASLKQPGCSAPNWMPVFASAFGYGDLIEDLGARVNVCDPLNGINYSTRVSVALATGHPRRALAVIAMAQKTFRVADGPSTYRAIALAMLGRTVEAQSTLASMEPSGEGYYVAQLIVGKSAGEDAATLYARLQKFTRKTSRYAMGEIADASEAALSGNRAEANRHAAALDARPAGGLLLAIVVTQCQCGAPFDLDAMPHFKTLLAESGLRWPPPQNIAYPARGSRQASATSATAASTRTGHE